MKLDIEALAQILKNASVAEIMPRFRRLDAGMVRQKSSAVDLVTEADEAAERHIQDAVSKLMPDALFVGEEAATADPGLIDSMNDAELSVVIDPIDGTSNYAYGLPLFGVMAAVVSKGETIAGIIYDPLGDDWILAEKGAGARQVMSDGTSATLKVAAPVSLENMRGVASTSAFSKEARPQVLANLAKVKSFGAYRCAAHEYRTMASGHWHFMLYNKILPWDHLAGALIVQEAGAYGKRFDESDYLPHHLSGGLLFASDKECWEAVRSQIVIA